MSLFSSSQALKNINELKIPAFEHFRFLTSEHQKQIIACIQADANTLNSRLSAVRKSAVDPHCNNPLELESRMHLFFVAFLWYSDRASGHRFPEFLESIELLTEIRDWHMDDDAKAWFRDLFNQIQAQPIQPTEASSQLLTHVILEQDILKLSQDVKTILMSLAPPATTAHP